MQIPRGRQIGREAQIEREGAQLQQRRAATEIRAGAAAGAIASTAGSLMADLSQAEQEKYNRALAADADTAIAVATTRGTQQLTEIARERAITPEDIDSVLGGIREAFADKELPPGFQEAADDYIQKHAAEITAGARNTNYERAQTEARNSVVTAFTEAIDARDPGVARLLYEASVRDNDLFTPEQRAAFKTDLIFAEEMGKTFEMLSEGEVGKAEEYAKSLAARQNLSAAMTDRLQAEMGAAINRYRIQETEAELEAERVLNAQGRARAVADRVTAAQDFTALTVEDVANNMRNLQYGASLEQSTVNGLPVLEQTLKNAEYYARIDDFNSGAIPDPSSSKDREILSYAYEDAQDRGATPEQAALTVTQEWDVVPPDFIAEVAAAAQGSAAGLSEAATRYYFLRDSAPGASFRKMDERSMAMITEVNALAPHIGHEEAARRVFERSTTEFSEAQRQLADARLQTFMEDEGDIEDAITVGLEQVNMDGALDWETLDLNMRAQIYAMAQKYAPYVSTPGMAFSVAAAQAVNDGWAFTSVNSDTLDYNGNEVGPRWEKTRVTEAQAGEYRRALNEDLMRIHGMSEDAANEVELLDVRKQVPDYDEPLFMLQRQGVPVVDEATGKPILWTPHAPRSFTQAQLLKRAAAVEEFRKKLLKEKTPWVVQQRRMGGASG